MKHTKYVKRFLSILLCLSMLFGSAINVYADGPSVPSTDNSTTNGPSSSGNGGFHSVTDGVSKAGPMIFLSIRNIDTGSTDEDTRRNKVISQVYADCASGSGVYSGSSYGTYMFAISSSNSNPDPKIIQIKDGKKITDVPPILQSYVMSLFNGKFDSDFATWENLVEVLNALDGVSGNNLKDFYDCKTNICPALEWTVGIYESHNADSTHFTYRPSDLATTFSAWSNAYSNFTDFANAIGGPSCARHKDSDSGLHVHCRIWLGSHPGHSVQKTWADATKWAATNYIANSDGNKYYSRGYWSPYNGQVPTVKDSEYFFCTKSSPNGALSNVLSGADQTAGYELYIFASDETKARIEALANSNSTKTFMIEITTTDGNSSANSPDVKRKGWFKQLGIGPYHDPSFKNFSRPFNVDTSVGTEYNSKSSTTITLTAKDFNNLLKQSWYVNFEFLVKGYKGASSLSQACKFEVKITDDTGKTYDAHPDKLSGMQGYYDGSWDPVTSTNYCDWYDTVNTHEDWTFSTSSNVNVYAEIVANCVGSKSGTYDNLAADWNVAQGIPSTENLSVAAGGRAFSLDLAGKIHTLGAPIGAGSSHAMSNADGLKNSANPAAPITRTITFNVKLTDIWGENNPRCSLNCSGHTLFTKSQSVSPAKPSDVSEGSGTKPPVTWTCATCGATGQYTYTPGKDAVPASGTPGKPGYKGPEKATKGSWSGGHTCSWSVTFDCSSGTYGGSNGGVTENKQSPSANGSKQYWTSGTGSVTCGTKTWTYNSYSGPGELCLGYTTGYGCSPSNETNCVHHGTATYTFYLVETVDMYAYRELTAAKVYGLEKAEITSVNTDLISSNVVGRSSSNTNLVAKVWRANGEYDGKNGRVWFTQFANPGYCDWTSTSVTNTAGTTSYWLGDCTVTLTAYANSKIADYGNDGKVDALASSVNSDQGQKYKHWTTSNTYGSTTYQSQIGDTLTAEQKLAEACQIVNAWQYANKSSEYTVNIISDAVCINVAGAGSQNVLAESYAVDNGISMFNYGFIDNAETYYRNHATKYGSADELSGYFKSKTFWDSYDSFSSLDNANTMIVGYNGVPSSNPDDKYDVIGRRYGSFDKTIIGSLGKSSLGGYTSNGERWGINSISTGTNGCYTRLVGTSEVKAGITEASTNTSGTSNKTTFSGYYTKFSYPNMGNYTVEHKLNGSVVGSGVNVTNSGPDNLKSYTNDDGSTIDYQNALVISNIPMKYTAENGKYTSPIKVKATYVKFIDLSTKSRCSTCSDGPSIDDRTNLTFKAKFTNDLPSDTLNDVVIHDPVSVEYWQVIGNGYGDYDGNGPAVDETGEDFRTITSGIPETVKDNYVVIGNTFHLWVTDFGDLMDTAGGSYSNTASFNRGVGCTLEGANVNTGVVNTKAKGYTDDMNTGRWVKERAVMFEFPVGCYLSDGSYVAIPAYTWIDLSKLRCNTANGYGTLSEAFHGAPPALNSTSSPTWDLQFKYGLDYEFVLLTSAYENVAAGVNFRTRAINEGDTIDCSMMLPNNEIREGNYQADSAVYKRNTLAVVGRIGNLALEDVGDFRFSNLFKKAEDTWLINGVVHRVNPSYPVKILTTENDIIGNKRLNTGVLSSRSHATLSVTNYIYGSTSGLGKAGYWDTLPLTAEDNNVKELSAEQMRMGYSAYFDIETIGNYYGINDSDGYTSAADESLEDERTQVMTVIPHYYLYDYEDGKFYAVDLYSGSAGAYTKYYTSTGTAKVVKTVESSLYIDLPNEAERRNVTTIEKNYTANVLNALGFSKAAYLKSDYIGTAMGIILDANDLDYIGSAYLYSDLNVGGYNSGSGNQLGNEDMFSGWYNNMSETSALDFMRQSQRWYFTLAVPSSTIATYPEADVNNQTDIVASHEKLKSQHPNSVIVAFAEITVHGTVYELKYNAKTINGSDIGITLFGNDNKPDNWQAGWHNTISLSGSGLDVYNSRGDSVIGHIEQEWAPLVVYDAYDTSNKDLDTYGTH